jgi:hypothetical protein
VEGGYEEKKTKKPDGPIYRIRYSYETGDSFGSESRDDILEFEWRDYSVAKDALKRIEEHYEWYRGKEHPYAKEVPKPKWYKVNGDHSEPHCINLKLDNGKDIQFWCPWCGYFERLYGAEILVDNGKIKINE